MRTLEDIATLEPGKNAELAAKKISEKYKKIREAQARKKFILPGEEVKIETIKTDDGEVKVQVPMEKPEEFGKQAAKKIIKKYDKIRHEKAHQMLVDIREKKEKTKKN